jgi:hypothetical protein
VLRASAACEAAGVPTASLTCDGFLGQGRATAQGLGYPDIAMAKVLGHPAVQRAEELKANVLSVTLQAVIDSLVGARDSAPVAEEPSPRDVVFRGGYDAVNDHFVEHGWSDGLPIVPPTRARIERFLAQTRRSPDEFIGVMLPDRRAATVWSVAVNGVMAGCTPETMPILVALAEAMADPVYGVEHSGNTPGAETLILLNGAIVKELGFNFTQGVMRDGFRPNTSVGRFWRLFLRNVAGFMPHSTDKATFGNTWRVVVAENHDALQQLGWQPICADVGLGAADDAVTVARYTGGDLCLSIKGSTPPEMMPYLTEFVVRQTSWQVVFSTEGGGGTLRPLILLSPLVAGTLARSGWSKRDIQRHLFEHARISAARFEELASHGELNDRSLFEQARAGKVPAFYGLSDDPERLVPLVWAPEHYMIAVTGDPARNHAYVFAHNGRLGFPVSKRIVR